MKRLLGLVVLCFGCEPPPETVTSDPNAVLALLPMSLSFVSDSDGQVPKAGAGAVLMFEPGGQCSLYREDDSGARATTGTCAFDGQRLQLQFTAPDFTHSGIATLDLTKTTVSLPFRVLSNGSGSSSWTIDQRGIISNLFLVFSSAFLGGTMTAEEAVDRTVAYGQAQADMPADSPAAPASQGIASVVKHDRRTLEICFVVSGCALVRLYNWVLSKVDGVPLNTQNPIVTSDILDEIHLPGGEVPPDKVVKTDSDPLEKWALFFITQKIAVTRVFYIDGEDRTSRLYGWDEILRSVTANDPSGEYGFDNIKSFVAGKGYPVVELSNDLATADGTASLANLVLNLLPASKGGSHAHSPGILYYLGHGGQNGEVIVGDTLDSFHPAGADENDPRSWADAYQGFIQDLFVKLPEAQFPGLAGGLTASAKQGPDRVLLKRMYIEGGKPILSGEQGYVHAIAVKPAFWKFIRDYGADFSRSLVYMDSCDTDATPDLREAISARAYFAYSDQQTIAATAIFYYLCQNLLRHTHTAEEAYYNVLRILRTKQTIYDEDTLLDGMPNWECDDGILAPLCQANTREQLATTFHGYGLGPSATPPQTGMVNYLDGAWLTDEKPGNIWWLLFKHRWYINSGMVQSLLSCWTDWWSMGDQGPMTVAPTCYDEAPGEAPTQDEVATASYMDVGAPVVPTSKLLLPRWTWNDGNP
jgi:hypothetical protein